MTNRAYKDGWGRGHVIILNFFGAANIAEMPVTTCLVRDIVRKIRHTDKRL